MIQVAIKNAGLADQVQSAIARAMDDVAASLPLVVPPIVRLRTRRRFETLGPARIEGKLAIVRVTAQNARRLPDLVDAIRAARPAGVQLVWNGVEPARESVERHVFAVLERARAAPADPPVILAKGEDPDYALTVLVAHRAQRLRRENGSLA